jgi:hypothetical protein
MGLCLCRNSQNIEQIVVTTPSNKVLVFKERIKIKFHIEPIYLQPGEYIMMINSFGRYTCITCKTTQARIIKAFNKTHFLCYECFDMYIDKQGYKCDVGIYTSNNEYRILSSFENWYYK